MRQRSTIRIPTLRRRTVRRGIGPLLAILVLLFSQFVTAAYVCPNDHAQQGGKHAAMVDCEGASGAAELDLDQPLLCQASCDEGAQASSSLVATDLPPAGVLLYLLPPVSDERAAPRVARHLQTSLGEPPPGWPPVYLLHLALRN